MNLTAFWHTQGLPLKEMNREQVARALAMAASVAILFSIAAAQILQALAIVAVLSARLPWRWPFRWPLAAFFAGTLVALALSPDPAGGWPQLKKFYVYLMLPLLATTLRGPADVRRLLMYCLAAGVISSLWSYVQFGRRWFEAADLGVAFYRHYVAQRTTGFMSHWQTFGGQMMMIFTAALAGLLFLPRIARERRWLWAALGVVGTALLLNETRGNWIGAGFATVYVVAKSRPRLLWLLPVVFGALMLIPPVRDRAVSIVAPNEVDSNQHRKITWRTGLNMIQAHPWFGIGPDQVQKQFDRYVPPDVARPLPDGNYGHLHNNYLQYAADRGIPTALCFCWMLWAMAHAWWRHARSEVTGQRRAILEAAIAVWLGVVISGLFEWNLSNTEVLHLFLVFAAGASVVSPRTPE
jgi:putative inorganic carbon (HCO3(-)) transporter